MNQRRRSACDCHFVIGVKEIVYPEIIYLLKIFGLLCGPGAVLTLCCFVVYSAGLFILSLALCFCPCQGSYRQG